MTKIEPEHFPVPGMYIYFEKGKRGGISYISKIYSNNNIKYWKSYYPNQESKYIIYLDVNNYMMMKYLNSFQQEDSNG